VTPIPFDGGLVLFDAPGQRLHVLNAGAAIIWTMIDAGLSESEAAKVVAERAGLSPDEAALHVDVISWLWRPAPAAPAAPVAAAPTPAEREISDPGAPFIGSIRGTAFAVTCEDDSTWFRVVLALADCADADARPAFRLHVAAPPEGAMRLLRDGEEILSSGDDGEMAGAVFQAILERVNPGIDWLGLMHGAAVARDGAALLLPGASGSGKSTLAAFLAARGDLYLADDLIALRADGRLVPWPTPFSVKRGSWPVLQPYYPELGRLPEVELLNRRIKFVPVGRAPWSHPPLPAAAIAFPHHSMRDEPGVAPIPPLEALAKLADERLWLGDPITEASIRRFLAWLATVPAYRITYRSLEDAGRQIEEILQAAASRRTRGPAEA
jgi:hypothetical protein